MTRIREITVQQQLALFYRNIGYSVQREVRTPVGIIDFILTDIHGTTIMVETKEKRSIKHAIGQLQSYAVYRPCDRYEVIYFCSTPSKSKIDISLYGHTIANKPITIRNVSDYISTDVLLSSSNFAGGQRSDDKGETKCIETQEHTNQTMTSKEQQQLQNYTVVQTSEELNGYLLELNQITGLKSDRISF